MAHIAPLQRERGKDFETVFAVTEAVMGFVPNSMLIMAIRTSSQHSLNFLPSLSYVRVGLIQA